MGFKGHGFAKLVSHQENGCIYVGYRGDTMGYITDLAIWYVVVCESGVYIHHLNIFFDLYRTLLLIRMAGKVFLDKFKVGLIVAVNSLAEPTYGSEKRKF